MFQISFSIKRIIITVYYKMPNTLLCSSFICLICVISQSTAFFLPKNDSNQVVLFNDQLSFTGSAVKFKMNHSLATDQYTFQTERDPKFSKKIIRNVYEFPNVSLSDPMSLVIVFDVTSSSESSFRERQHYAEWIVNAFSMQQEYIFNYILFQFQGTCITEPMLVTTNKHELLITLNSLNIYVDGDCSRNILNTIIAALKQVTIKSNVYIFTDAVPKDFELGDKVISLIQKKQATVSATSQRHD